MEVEDTRAATKRKRKHEVREEDGEDEEREGAKSFGPRSTGKAKRSGLRLRGWEAARWGSLPPELHLRILAYLPIKQVLIARQVCKEWHALTDDESLWRNLHVTQLGRLDGQTQSLLQPDFWKRRTLSSLKQLANMRVQHEEKVRRRRNKGIYESFVWALSQNYSALASSIAEENPSFVHYRYTRDITPLLKAVSAGHVDVVNTLIKVGASLNDTDGAGATPLMAAVCMADDSMVSFLLEHPDVNVNAEDTEGWTALHWAVWSRKPDAVKRLLQRGADPHKKAQSNETPLSLARDSALVTFLIPGQIKKMLEQAVDLATRLRNTFESSGSRKPQ